MLHRWRRDGRLSEEGLGWLVLNEVKWFRVIFALNAVEEFLGVRANLGSRPRTNELFHLLPILSVVAYG